jgi:hypothetical protein
MDLLSYDSKPISQPLFPERRRDYERFRAAIFGQEPDYVPLAEMFVESDVKAGLLGHPIRGHADEVKFWSWAGYDYYPISLSVVSPSLAPGAGLAEPALDRITAFILKATQSEAGRR